MAIATILPDDIDGLGREIEMPRGKEPTVTIRVYKQFADDLNLIVTSLGTTAAEYLETNLADQLARDMKQVEIKAKDRAQSRRK